MDGFGSRVFSLPAPEMNTRFNQQYDAARAVMVFVRGISGASRGRRMAILRKDVVTAFVHALARYQLFKKGGAGKVPGRDLITTIL